MFYSRHSPEMTVSVGYIMSAFRFRIERSDTKSLSANILRTSAKGQSGFRPVAPLGGDTSVSSCLLSTSYYARRRNCGSDGVRSVDQSHVLTVFPASCF